MIWKTTFLWFVTVSLHFAEGAKDILRFSNGDQLHGSFQGFKKGALAVWQREDLTAPIELETDELRHIVIQGGEPQEPLKSLSHAALVSGDRIPGKLISLDQDFLTMETLFAGTVRIPRNQVAMIAPSPLGGRVYYHGPFVETGWKMAHPSYPDGLPTLPPSDAEIKVEKPNPGSPGRWQFSGSAWYWPNKVSGTALLHENLMSERSVLRFDLAWKNRLSVAVAFHADFRKSNVASPVAGDKADEQRKAPVYSPGDSALFPVVFGNSHVIQIFPTHLMLFRSSVGEDGTPRIERVKTHSNPIRLGDVGKAQFEIRSNRLTSEISLFINGDFVAQWSENADQDASAVGNGSGFGFVVQSEESPIKVSDIMVAEWNGMPDAARSLQVDDQDIALLANGTDRFSGKVGAFKEGKILFDAKYGSFNFDLEDVAEIRFARNRLAKPVELGVDQMTVRLSPIGKISGRPISGDSKIIQILNPECGELDVQLESAVMLDFANSNTIIDDWESEF